MFYRFYFYSYRALRYLHSFPTRRSSDLRFPSVRALLQAMEVDTTGINPTPLSVSVSVVVPGRTRSRRRLIAGRSEEHTSELQSQFHLVCRLLLEKKKITWITSTSST